MKQFVEVEISVFKPQGYSITYLVEGTNDRWAATKRAVLEFKKQDAKAMSCLNYISARLSQPRIISNPRNRDLRVFISMKHKYRPEITSKDVRLRQSIFLFIGIATGFAMATILFYP